MITYPPKEVQIKRAIKPFFRTRDWIYESSRNNATELSPTEDDSITTFYIPTRRKKPRFDNNLIARSSITTSRLNIDHDCIIIDDDDDNDTKDIETIVITDDDRASIDRDTEEVKTDSHDEDEILDNTEQLDQTSTVINDDMYFTNNTLTRPKRKRKSKGCIMCESLSCKN